MSDMHTNESAFWQQSPDHWLQMLESSGLGLSEAVAAGRQRKGRSNGFAPSSIRRDLSLLLRQFKSPLMLLLIGAVFLSAFLGDTSDVLIILFILLSSGLLGFIQERNAGRVV